jgi:SAM-dependent methyltransferase
MGLGPPILALYRQLKLQGAFDGIGNVIELGAQAVWCPKQKLVASLFEAFGRPAPPADMLDRFANWKGSGRELYEALGFTYQCVDLDPSFESVKMDLNYDAVPADKVGRFDFVTNHGTTEHILNQLNCFKCMHDFCRAGGLFIHAVPFTVHLEHGFFNYQPNFFSALARHNSYETLGVWVGPDWQLDSLVPWEPALLDYLVLNAKTTHLLVVLQRKLYDTPFCVPFQEVYEGTVPDDAYARYSIVVDGEQLDGARAKQLSRDHLTAEITAEITPQLKARLTGQVTAEVREKLAAELSGQLPPQLTSELKEQLIEQLSTPQGAAQLPPILAKVRGMALVAEVRRRILRRLFGRFGRR